MDRKSFERLGYVRIPGALGPGEVRLLTEALIELEGRPRRELPPSCPRSHAPARGETRLLDVFECGPPFEGLGDHAAILPHVRRIVRGPLRLTRAHAITRRAGAGLPLHRIEPAPLRLDRAGPHCDHVTAEVWLTDVGPFDGPMVVFEGSHRGAGELPFARFHPAWDLPSNELEDHLAYLNARWSTLPVPWERIPGYREIHARAGDVLLLAGSLWHGAREVRSDRVRRSLTLSFRCGPPSRESGLHRGAVPAEDDVTRVNIGLVRALVRARCGDPRPSGLVGLDGTMHLLAGAEACWTLAVADGRLAIRSGLAGRADVVLRCALEALVGLIEGRLDADELLRLDSCAVEGEALLARRLLAALFPDPTAGRDAS